MQLVVVDGSLIQPYIFGSNRLRENVGGSYLVAQATRDWALQCVPTPSNVRGDLSLDSARRIEDDPALRAEVIYAGGGNVVVLCRDQQAAREFTRALSRRALVEAPELQLVVAHLPFEWGSSLAGVVADCFRELSRRKRSRAHPAPLLGLGVTAACQSTGLPAVGYTEPISDDPTSEYPASAEILAKRAAVGAAKQRLRAMLPPPDGYDYPDEFDDLGRTAGEQSHLAVLHADGDGIGDRILAIRKPYRDPTWNRDYIEAIRAFSHQLNITALHALKRTLDALYESPFLDRTRGVIKYAAGYGEEMNRIALKKKGGKWLLPVRPIVFGGDDVTLVCDGRLGIALAVRYLREFAGATGHLPDGEGAATASAGIAIVKAHYPFARAYEMAEELTRSAKRFRREDVKAAASCLDWHFAQGGLHGSLEEIRGRHYAVEAGRLTLRPLTLKPVPGQGHRAWSVVQRGIRAFQGDGWTGRRNKLKGLYEALRDGPEAVKRFRSRFNKGAELPAVQFPSEPAPVLNSWRQQGWEVEHCGYFDALEMADWFIPLTTEAEDEARAAPHAAE